MGGEYGVVTVIEGQLNLERAVVLQFGGSVAADRIALVKAAPVKKDNAPAVFKLGGGVDCAKAKLGPAPSTDLQIGGSGEIEIVAIPQIGGDDPPAADDFATGWAAHAAPAPCAYRGSGPRRDHPTQTRRWAREAAATRARERQCHW